MTPEVLYYVRLKQQYRWYDVQPIQRISHSTECFFASREEAEAFRSATLPPESVNPLYMRFVNGLAWSMYEGRPNDFGWLTSFIEFVADSGLPPIPPVVMGAADTEGPPTPWSRSIMPLLRNWWQDNIFFLSRAERFALWQFVDEEPFEIVPLPLMSETDPVLAMAAVDDLLKPHGLTSSDYPQSLMDMRRYRFSSPYEDETEIPFPAPSDADAPPDCESPFEL